MVRRPGPDRGPTGRLRTCGLGSWAESARQNASHSDVKHSCSGSPGAPSIPAGGADDLLCPRRASPERYRSQPHPVRSGPGRPLRAFDIRYRRSPVEQERQPSQQAWCKKPLAIALLPVAVLLLSWYTVAGGGHGSARGCPTVAVAMCPASHTSGRAAGASAHQETGSSAHQEIGPRASGIQTRQTPP